MDQQSTTNPKRIGFYLGRMSGEGSGSHSRICALVEALSASSHQIFVYGRTEALEGLTPRRNVHLRTIPDRGRISVILAPHFQIRRLVAADKLDLIQFETIPVVGRVSCPSILSIHHLDPTGRNSPSGRWPVVIWIRNLFIKRSAKRATRVVTLTDWSKLDIVRKFGLPPEKVTVVPFTSSGITKAVNAGPFAPRTLFQLPIPKTFVLALGHVDRRKNLEVLIKATSSRIWPADTSLVLAGRDNGHRSHLEALSVKLNAPVIFTDAVDETTKWRLIKGAQCVLMPSLLEGFGIPIIEALVHGTPVYVSNRSALPEVIGIREAVLSADDPKAWATAVRRTIEYPDHRSRLLELEQQQLTRYQPSRALLAYTQIFNGLATNKGTFPHILHLAFGGLGGHRAVINQLSTALAPTKIRSAAIFVAPIGENDAKTASTHLDSESKVNLRRRGDLLSMIQVFKLTRQRHPGVVLAHSHRHIPAVWLAFWAIGRRPRIVLVEHQSLKLRSSVDNFQSAIGICLSRGVIFLTEDYRNMYPLKRLVALLRRPNAVIPNGVSLPTKSKEFSDTFTSPFVLGMASRLIPSKGHEDVIRAIALLKSEGNWQLRIAGSGPDSERLEGLVRDLDLSDLVFFDGALDYYQMSDWYLALDTYIHVSKGETLSMSVLEAAAHGVPIIASEEVGVRRIFESSAGAEILPNNSPQTIANTVRMMANSEDLKDFGLQARELIQRLFDESKMAKGYISFLSQIGALPPQLAVMEDDQQN